MKLIGRRGKDKKKASFLGKRLNIVNLFLGAWLTNKPKDCYLLFFIKKIIFSFYHQNFFKIENEKNQLVNYTEINIIGGEERGKINKKKMASFLRKRLKIKIVKFSAGAR